MHTGMLWFDNSQTALNIKIQKAVDYYHKKYGHVPDLCLVHPSMLEKNEITHRNQQINGSPLSARVAGPHLDWHRGQKLSRVPVPCKTSRGTGPREEFFNRLPLQKQPNDFAYD